MNGQGRVSVIAMEIGELLNSIPRTDVGGDGGGQRLGREPAELMEPIW